ncbi:occlusion-derived virus envelope protein [Condylorrhiza vestigialis mutiple nucleopolyhedrovirus]|uniref:Occlusion-derived virus envelope protein n=1 Tax=Condylorrhiza vestigialis mutiple nucleopolyhedrovirus TaxID=1592576 RepID=A0A0B4UL06_9ABAC|nr:occlusion-derived virus envelope protein [Condylorrhiza vestigialis mutiple nucleopolyhedrovirus]AJD09207.1 occlusion-derived virus envelope protein [Condylorrhiza vestigialis mutiple nucleopolyhedrovirus]
MECPFQIKVCVSDRFFAFPYNLVEPQSDVGNRPTENLIVYVPTEIDKLYVEKRNFPRFRSVLVYKHEHDYSGNSQSPKKTGSATIVYWNPLVPITEIGAGETRVFSVLLTNNLFYCNTLIVHHENPTCPIEFTYPGLEMQPACKSIIKSKKLVDMREHALPLNYKDLRPINCEMPLAHFKELTESDKFLLCFNLETPTMVKILSLKRIFCIFQYRRLPACYVINLPHEEIDSLYNKLNWERTRRLLRGDIPSNCATVNRASLNYVKDAQTLLHIAECSQTIVEFVKIFQKLIFPYQIVPIVIVKLNSLNLKSSTDAMRNGRVRVFCKNDSVAITLRGSVPVNMPDNNPFNNTFDNSEFDDITELKKIADRVSVDGVFSHGVAVHAMHYNYFL